MTIRTQNIAGTILLAPATTASGYGDVFTVGGKSAVCRLTTPAGEDVGVDDAFELYTVLTFNKETGVPTRAYATKEVDPVSGTSFGLFLGANNTQAEIILRGIYAWKKIQSTTPSVGVERIEGFEAFGN